MQIVKNNMHSFKVILGLIKHQERNVYFIQDENAIKF